MSLCAGGEVTWNQRCQRGSASYVCSGCHGSRHPEKCRIRLALFYKNNLFLFNENHQAGCMISAGGGRFEGTKLTQQRDLFNMFVHSIFCSFYYIFSYSTLMSFLQTEQSFEIRYKSLHMLPSRILQNGNKFPLLPKSIITVCPKFLEIHYC